MEIENINTSKANEKKGNKALDFLKKHKISAIIIGILSFLLILNITTSRLKVSSLNNEFKEDKNKSIELYSMKMDSLNTENLKLTAKVFSWAIRSELIRENTDQVNQFFNTLIKEEGVSKIQFVDKATSMVKISTDKKDEGKLVANDPAMMSDVITAIKIDSTRFNIIAPVLGLDRKIGNVVLFMEQPNRSKEFTTKEKIAE